MNYLFVVKRDGSEVIFEENKVRNALIKSGLTDDNKLNFIVEDVLRAFSDKDKLTVDNIQHIVENALMGLKEFDIARNYITYRYLHDVARNKYNELLNTIEDKLFVKSRKNQNANVDEESFGGRVGETSDAIMKQYALDYCMSDKSKYNHENNIIYIHDLSSYAIGNHNCFDANTKIVTKHGVKAFKNLRDGEVVEIIDKDGNWRKATVKNYGKQKFYKLTFRSSLTTHTVCCTKNHRWVLQDGTITDNIQIGDKLYNLHELQDTFIENNKLWCFGFVLGDGCDINKYSKDRTHITNGSMQVRLCGNKVRYLDKFLSCGYGVVQTIDKDIFVSTLADGGFKQIFLDNKIWKLMSHDDLCNIFMGYVAAGGHKCDSGSISISTADNRVAEFIEYASSVVGYHIWSYRVKNGVTNFSDDRILYEYHLVKYQRVPWELIKIEADIYKSAWCVEEPITHTFTLYGGMVTGNCLSIPFDDLLSRGFNTRQTDVRPAQSVSTAFQLVAVIFQLQSLQQFGGVSATHLDWTMIPYVRKSFNRHYCVGLKYTESESLVEKYKKLNIEDTSIDDDIYKEHANAYKYAMDMTIKEIEQSVEGMYHNLNN